MPELRMAATTDSEFAETTTLDQTEGSVMEVLHRTCLGDVHQDYYLPIFLALERQPTEPPRWNWSASLLTLNWLLYRRLWGAALIYAGAVLAAALLVGGLIPLMLPGENGVVLAVSAVLLALGFWVPGRYGNTLLFAASQKKMNQALHSTHSLKEACAQLTRQAPTRRQWLGQLLINLGLAGLAGLAVLGWGLADQSSPQASESAQAPTHLTPTLPLTEPAPPHAVPGPLESVASAPVTTASMAAPALSGMASAPPPSASAPALSPAVTPPPAPPQEPLVTAALSSPSSAQAAVYAINVGLFTQPGNARRAHDQLKKAQLAVVTTSLSTPHGLRYRVRVGPFATLADAHQAAEHIRTLKLEAVVIEL